MKKEISINLISTFGPNIRGVSPYSDDLSASLEKLKNVKISKTDYTSPYPSLLHPAGKNKKADNNYATLHYAKPSTWYHAVNREGADIIHIQYWSSILSHMLLGIILIAKRKNIPTVITVHNARQHEHIPLLGKLENLLLSKTDKIIVHTTDCKTTLCSTLNINPSKIVVISHGVKSLNPTPITEKDYKTANLSQEFNYILYFGNIRHYKGVDVLLDAWKTIEHKNPTVQLIVAGSTWKGKGILSKITGLITGNNRTSASIENRLKNFNKERVIYRPHFINEQELCSLIRISKYVIFPYRRFHAQSGAASKAAALGTPIITSNAGGLPELAINKSYVCHPLTPKSLADTIQSKLCSFTNNHRQQQVAVTNDFTWEKVALSHKAVYRSLNEK